MISRTELFDALWTSREHGCPRKCSKCRRGGNCATVNSRSDRFRRAAALLTLLLDLRDLLAEAMLVRALVADQLEQPAKPSPAWVWVTPSAYLTRGTLDDGILHAHVTVLGDHALATVRCEGNVLELRTALPAWSQAQQRRWVEQWVASQADAAAAAFEAAEGMR